MVRPLLAVSCAFASVAAVSAAATQEREAAAAEITLVQQRLVDAALSLVGTDEPLTVRDRRFSMDCSGVVLAAHYAAGIDLAPHLASYTGGGVERLHARLSDLGLLHTRALPEAGDVVFWDDTYDRDGNGKRDDALTHTAVVVSVEPSGAITYVHHHYRRGVVVERMNLLHREVHTTRVDGETVVVNSPMRLRGSGSPGPWLASQLFRAFGSAHEIGK
jgi:hypothetical protein